MAILIRSTDVLTTSRMILPKTTFASAARNLDSRLASEGLRLSDMRSEPRLETRLASLSGEDASTASSLHAGPTEWLEPTEPFARRVNSAENIGSRFRYFLDGSQRTLPAWHVGSIPILAGVVTAAILERSESGETRLFPGTLSTRRVWLAPRNAGSDAIDHFIAATETEGIEVIDPLESLAEDEYQASLNDFSRVEQLAYRRVMALRADLEQKVLISWIRKPRQDGGWLVVDGALREEIPQTVGLVKSFTRHYFAGDDAAALYQLPADHRTAMFRMNDGWRDGTYSGWYLRMQNASGRDPRHALIRLETPITDRSDEVEAISGSILAERSPRASADPRWASLLYPIHILEQILRKHLDSETRLWPGGKG